MGAPFLHAVTVLLLLLGARADSTTAQWDGLPTLYVRPLSAYSAEVEVDELSFLLDCSTDGSLTFGAHRAASLDLTSVAAETIGLHLGEIDAYMRQEELLVFWSEEGHFPRLYLNATSLESLQILAGPSDDSLVVHHMPVAFRGHLEINTGDGNDRIVMDHALDTGRSLTMRSGGSVDIRKALSTCPIEITVPGNLDINASCVCGGSADITITAGLLLNVTADVVTDAGALTLQGFGGLIIDSSATVSTASGDLTLEGVSTAGPGVALQGGSLVLSVTGEIDIMGTSTNGPGLQFRDSLLASNGGDATLSGQGTTYGIEMDQSTISLVGVATMFLSGVASTESTATGYGLGVTNSILDTDGYVVSVVTSTDSASPLARGPCVAIEISSTSVTASGVWNLLGDNQCDVDDGNVGVNLSFTTFDYGIGSLTVAGSTANSITERSTGVFIKNVTGTLPQFQANGLASGINPSHGLHLDTIDVAVGGEVSLFGAFQGASGTGTSATSVSSSRITVAGDFIVDGVLSPSGVRGTGVVVTGSSINADLISIDGNGSSDDSMSQCGVLLAAITTITSFGDTVINGRVKAFQNDFGVRIEAGTTVDCLQLTIDGATSTSNSASHGLFLGGTVMTSGGCSVYGNALGTEDGIGIFVDGGSFVSSGSTAFLLLLGQTDAFDLGAGVLLRDFTWTAIDSPTELMFIRGDALTGSPADGVRLEGTTTIGGAVNIVGAGTQRPTRGNGIVVSGPVNSNSMGNITLTGTTAMASTFSPEQSIGVVIEDVLTCSTSVSIQGMGPIGVSIAGRVISLGGSVSIVGQTDPGVGGTGTRNGVRALPGSDVVADGLLVIDGTSSRNTGASLSGFIRTSGDISLSGDGPQDVNEVGLLVDGTVICSGLTMMGRGSTGVEISGDVTALTLDVTGICESAGSGTCLGVLLAGLCNVPGSVSIVGRATHSDVLSIAGGVIANAAFDLLPSFTASDPVVITGSSSVSGGAGVIWGAQITSEREITLDGLATPDLGAVESATGVLLRSNATISTGRESLFVDGSATGSSAIGLDVRGGTFESYQGIHFFGNLFGTSVGTALRVQPGAQFFGTGLVEMLGDARDSVAGDGLLLEETISLPFNARITGIGGCAPGFFGLGLRLNGRLSVGGDLQLRGSGCVDGSAGSHGIVFAPATGLVVIGACDVRASGGSEERRAGVNMGILFESGFGNENIVICTTISISVAMLDIGPFFNGLSVQHPTNITSSEGIDIIAEGFIGVDVLDSLSFGGNGPVVITSDAQGAAVGTADGVTIIVGTQPGMTFTLEGDLKVGADVMINTRASTFVVEQDVSGISLIFSGPVTNVTMGSVTLNRCSFNAFRVTLFGTLDAAATFCADVVLNGFDVTGASFDIQCGGLLTSTADINIEVDTFGLGVGSSIEGDSSVEIVAFIEATVDGQLELEGDNASFALQAGTATFSTTSQPHFVTGPILIDAAQLGVNSAAFSAPAIVVDVTNFAGDSPLLIATGGVIDIRSLSELRASSLVLDSASANVDIPFFSGNMTAVGSTALTLSTMQPSTSGSLVLQDFSTCMPFGSSGGCLDIDRLIMGDSSQLVMDLVEDNSDTCGADRITAFTAVILEDAPEVVFMAPIAGSLVRGDVYTFIDSPATSNSFANPPSLIGGVGATVVYGDAGSFSRSVLGAGDVSLLANQLPVATSESYVTASDDPLVVLAPGVLANDFDPDMTPLSMVLLTVPSLGVLFASPDGSFVWDPQEMTGATSFTYAASDGLENSSPATVALLSLLPSVSSTPAPSSSRSSSAVLSASSSRSASARSPTPSATPTPTMNFSASPSSVVVSPSRSPLVSAALVGPTVAPASPNPLPSSSSSSSRQPSATLSSLTIPGFLPDDDDGNFSGSGGSTTTVTPVTADSPPVVIEDPETEQPIATVDVNDMEGTLVISIVATDDSDIVSEVLDIEFFVNGQRVTRFDDGIEICFASRDDDDACLGFFDSDGDWECEDFCLEKDDEHNRMCGVTYHLTNFALLLDGDANSDSKCGSDKNDYVILYISAGMCGCCCVIVLVSIMAIEISIRRKKRKLAEEMDTLKRRTESVLAQST